jgi:hypothetical protein
VGPHTYEITFAGEAGSALRAEFDDCEVIVGQGMTTLRAELPDQGALWGILQRIIEFELQVIRVNLVTPPSAPSQERAQTDIGKWSVSEGGLELTAPGMHAGASDGTESQAEQDVWA